MYSFNSKLHACRIYTDNKGFPLLLPCFYSEYISTAHKDYHLKNVKVSKLSYEIKFDERDLSEKTVNSYALKLSNYLEWIEEYSADSKYVNLSTHHNIHQDIINSYLNNYLIQDKAKGLEAVTQHRAALHSYYTYLEVKGFSNRKNIYIIPDLKDVARRSTNKRTAIKYLSPGLRITLTEYAKTKRDALLIRTSSECGLRTMENRGLLLNDFRVGNKTHKGLLSLFKEMEDNEDQLEFTYYLQGIYSKGSHSKGGKSREVFISKSLLQSMREYWAEERAISDIDHLFLNNSNNNKEAICESRASKVFAEIRDRVILAQEEGLLDEGEQAIEKGHTHHCLRHTFGTDKFYDIAKENNILTENVTSTSLVYLAVAKLLGHTINQRYAPATTANYIRSCNYKEAFELNVMGQNRSEQWD